MPKRLFIDNWSAELLAPAGAAALALTVDEATAARLVGMTGGDYYMATLALLELVGTRRQETAWEIVKITANAAGVLTVARAQQGTTALDWSAGDSISVRITAADMATLQAKPDNPMTTAGDLIVAGAAGVQTRLPLGTNGQVLKVVGGALVYAAESSGSSIPVSLDTIERLNTNGTFAMFDPATKEYAAGVGPVGSNLAPGIDFSSLGLNTLFVGDNQFKATGTSADVKAEAALGLFTGTTSTSAAEVRMAPSYAGKDALTLVSQIGRIRLRATANINALSSSGERFVAAPIELLSSVTSRLSVSQVDNVNSGLLTVTYSNNAAGTTTVNTTGQISSTPALLEVDIAFTGGAWVVVVKLGGTTLATITDFLFTSGSGSITAVARSRVTKSVGTGARGMYIDSLRMEILKR